LIERTRMNMIGRRKVVKALVLAPFLQFTSHQALANNFPLKPIHVINPFASGGSVDVLSRYLGQKLSERVNQPIVVENRAGAGGTVGAALVANAAPDGYTLLVSNIASNAIAASLYPQLPYHALNAFEHIGMFGTLPNALLINPRLQVDSLRELIELAKSKPGTLTFGSAGNGSSPHLSGEMLKSQAGINIVHVPYKGAGPAMLDLMGGQISFLFENVPTAISVIKSGKLRVLGTTGSVRTPMLPDVATLKEQGLPNYVAESWHGFSAPANTPAEIVSFLNTELRATMSEPAVQSRLAELGVSTVSYTPSQYRAFIAAEIEKWQVVVKKSGARIG
jgi:tripartite-type tricarboxylate transporter receptor subunit TctC